MPWPNQAGRADKDKDKDKDEDEDEDENEDGEKRGERGRRGIAQKALNPIKPEVDPSQAINGLYILFQRDTTLS